MNQTNIDWFCLTNFLEIFKLKCRIMRKVFKRFICLFFVILSLGFGANVFVWNDRELKTEVADAVYYETDYNYLYDLFHDGKTLESSYDLTKRYPLIQENQTDSELCWIYTSMKSLESSFMVQTGEYYNFSEVGQEYLNYAYQVESGYFNPSFDTAGNFGDFVECYQNTGLILESDFSNTELEEIRNNEDKYEYYNYVKKYATKQFNSIVKPYGISNLGYYMGLSAENKRNVIKKYIKEYGAVFGGLEGSPVSTGSVGCFYFDYNAENAEELYTFYGRSRSKYSDLSSYYPLGANHAIVVVGWNDNVHFGSETGAFLVMNSWGFETNSYNFFYVPYSYDYFYNTFCGFICDDSVQQNVTLNSSSRSSFTTDVLTGSNELKNYYCYDDVISLNYKISANDFSGVEVIVNSGSGIYTDLFNISYRESDSSVTISLRQNLDYFYGGYYTINFYNGDLLLGKKSLYIFSGTEIGNFKLTYNSGNSGVLDSYSLSNAFLNLDSSTTVSVAGLRQNYFLSFNLIPTLSYYNIIESGVGSDVKDFTLDISEVSIVSSNNKSLETMYSSDDLVAEAGESSYQTRNALFIRNTMSQEGNKFVIQIGYGLTLDKLVNSLVRFKITINSILYENCSRDFYFNMYVSEKTYAETEYLNNIVYELNGGTNSTENPTKYPIYDGGSRNDPNMTSVELDVPTRSGYRFVGWYLNEDFSGEEVTTLDSNLSGNIKLYAKWDTNLVQYFYVNLVREDVSTIVYGDTVTLKLNITENPLADISGYNYQVDYWFYGPKIMSGTMMKGESSRDIILGYPDLVSGQHTFKMKVRIIITQNLSFETEKSINLTVEKKMLKFGFSDLEKVYNGKEQRPTVTMIEDFFEEDKQGLSQYQLFELSCLIQSKNYGTYDYYISKVFNENYTFDPNEARCVFKIEKKEITLNWKTYPKTYYDGLNHFPEYVVQGIVDGDAVNFGFTVPECKHAGDYTINIDPSTISNPNYTVSATSDFSFRIEKAKIKVILHNASDRVQTEVGRRAEPLYTIVGNYYSKEDLKLRTVSEAKTATRSGVYKLSCIVENESYDAEIQSANYTLTGYYYVYYQLSNGTTYAERVEEGQMPKGVSKENLEAPIFSKISYSEEFDASGEDLFVSVTMTDYTSIVYIGGTLGLMSLLYFLYYLKKKESKVR